MIETVIKLVYKCGSPLKSSRVRNIALHTSGHTIFYSIGVRANTCEFLSMSCFFLHTACGTLFSWAPSTQHQWDTAEVNSQVLVRVTFLDILLP